MEQREEQVRADTSKMQKNTLVRANPRNALKERRDAANDQHKQTTKLVNHPNATHSHPTSTPLPPTHPQPPTPHRLVWVLV